MTKALIIVDVQNDFIEGGSLGVDGGEAVALKLADYVTSHRDNYDLIVATQDWHVDPGEHWATDGDAPNYVTTWPVHCAAETRGAAIRDELQAVLNTTDNVRYVRKGQFEAAYSGFEGKAAEDDKLALRELLDSYGVNHVDVTGIATDYCVKATATDALHEGFDVTILTDMVAGVAPETSKQALVELENKGVNIG